MSVKITIIGTGYVGLVTGACFSELGHDVICVDADERKIEMIRSGKLPIYEPALDQLVARNVKKGRLSFSINAEESCKGREAVFLAVGTPSDPQSGRADLTSVFEAAMMVARSIDQFSVIVTKSTVPVGTNHEIHRKLSAQFGEKRRLAVASNPEFLREGAAVQDFMNPDRIVVGTEDPRALEVMERIYAPLIGKGVALVSTSIPTAEMIKYAANAFLAMKVSFINEVADICEAMDADVRDVANGIGLDHRIGTSFLRTGPGWGGSCFPKDTRALLMTAKDLGLPARLVEATITSNTARKASMVERIRKLCGPDLTNKRIGVLGLTFKGETDDMRDSPSLDILPPLLAAGAEVVAYDPSDPPDAARLLPGVRLVDSGLAAALGSDILVVMTDWMKFTTLDLAKMAEAMRHPVMLDLRNLFERQQVLEAGFTLYAGLGHSRQKERKKAQAA